MDFNIPLEIKDKSAFPQLKKNDRLTVAYAVLFGVGNQDAFMRFHPEYIDASGKQMSPAGKKASTQFWNYGKVKDYREAYESELAEFLGRSNKAEIGNELDELTEERKEKASKLLMLEVIKMIEAGKISDPEFAKLVTDLAIKMKITKEDVERVIAPIRVLMERCSQCRYRICVETAVSNGEILDMCKFCKCRKMAEEHGYRFNDGKDLLEIPQEIIADLESKNDVKLLDILDGKVEN